MEKVMQGFRARSQLLAETLEENDNVLQKEFVQSEAEDAANNNENFVRRGTYSVKKKYSKGKSGESEPSELDLLTKSSEIRMKVIKESEVKLKDAQQKMRDLNINIR